MDIFTPCGDEKPWKSHGTFFHGSYHVGYVLKRLVRTSVPFYVNKQTHYHCRQLSFAENLLCQKALGISISKVINWAKSKFLSNLAKCWQILQTRGVYYKVYEHFKLYCVLIRSQVNQRTTPMWMIMCAILDMLLG